MRFLQVALRIIRNLNEYVFYNKCMNYLAIFVRIAHKQDIWIVC